MVLIKFKYKKKDFEIDAEKCGVFGKVRGLMFRRRESAPALLLFDFKKPARFAIHSFFVFFPFWAVWLDDKNHVVEGKIVKPWNFYVVPKESFCRLIEIPVSRKYRMFHSPTGIRKI